MLTAINLVLKQLEIQTLVCYKMFFFNLSNEASFELVSSCVRKTMSKLTKLVVINPVFTKLQYYLV